MKEKLSEERAVDTVGRPGVKMKSFGKKGGEAGSSRKGDKGGSARGIGTGIGTDAKEEPIFHEAAYRAGKDKNYDPKVESGLPRQEASYQNRDRQGSGLDNENTYQKKLRSYPMSSPKTKKGKVEDD